jgi:hypothetical protein
MTLSHAITFRWLLWRRLPGLTSRRRFARLLLRALVAFGEHEADRDLTLIEAEHLAYLFMSWAHASIPAATLIENPIRTLNLYLTTEPWRRQLAAADTPQEAAS